MKRYSLLIIGLVVSSKIYAVAPGKREIVQELIQKLEATDPNIKAHQSEWLKVREHLEQSAQQSESTAGLKLSVQHILDQWMGLRFRVLDETDAQYWALNGQSLTLPRAWFQQKGARWVVQYAENDLLRRGDNFLLKDFSPYSKENQGKAEWTLPFPKPVTVKTDSKPLSDWSIDLTQKASKTLIIDNRKVCIEKAWFWLDKAVGQSLNSKLTSGLCEGMLIDLRDSFGEGLERWELPKKSIPIAVLVNRGTREGVVRFARTLQKDAKAKVFGEPTETDRPLQKKEPLQSLSWNLVVIGDGGEVLPDQPVKDSFMNAEGVDDIREAGLSWLKAAVIKSH